MTGRHGRTTIAAAAITTFAVLGVSGCTKTVYDASIPSGPVAATTTTAPSGDAATLLPRLVHEAGLLSGTITSDGDKTAVADQITSLWAASKQEVGKGRPELLGSFEGAVALSNRAATFNRAADADKAFRNLTDLVTAFLGTPPPK
ncbi:MAG: hypothetical protein ABIQ39_14380 [Ilumatobacteraceae bacterium]